MVGVTHGGYSNVEYTVEIHQTQLRITVGKESIAGSVAAVAATAVGGTGAEAPVGAGAAVGAAAAVAAAAAEPQPQPSKPNHRIYARRG